MAGGTGGRSAAGAVLPPTEVGKQAKVERGRRLKRCRLEAGARMQPPVAMSQGDFADLIASMTGLVVDQSRISRAELGVLDLYNDENVAVAALSGRTLAYVVGGEAAELEVLRAYRVEAPAVAEGLPRVSYRPAPAPPTAGREQPAKKAAGSRRSGRKR